MPWPRLTHLHLRDTVLTSLALEQITAGLGDSLQLLDVSTSSVNDPHPHTVARWSAGGAGAADDVEEKTSTGDEFHHSATAASRGTFPHLHTLWAGGDLTPTHLPLPLPPALTSLHLSHYTAPQGGWGPLAEALAAPGPRAALTALSLVAVDEPFPPALAATVTVHLTALTRLSLREVP